MTPWEQAPQSKPCRGHVQALHKETRARQRRPELTNVNRMVVAGELRVPSGCVILRAPLSGLVGSTLVDVHRTLDCDKQPFRPQYSGGFSNGVVYRDMVDRRGVEKAVDGAVWQRELPHVSPNAKRRPRRRRSVEQVESDHVGPGKEPCRPAAAGADISDDRPRRLRQPVLEYGGRGLDGVHSPPPTLALRAVGILLPGRCRPTLLHPEGTVTLGEVVGVRADVVSQQVQHPGGRLEAAPAAATAAGSLLESGIARRAPKQGVKP